MHWSRCLFRQNTILWNSSNYYSLRENADCL